jgi:pyruvate formate lyase activating enzyme
MLPSLEKDLKECILCEHRCGVNRLAGELGVCRMAGPVVASRCLHPAPPESYTVFMAGCNFKCLNCQNWSISQYPDNGQSMEGLLEPEFLAKESIRHLESSFGRIMKADRIFFSGGEATVHLPYIEQVVAHASKKRSRVKVNFDTNGFMTPESLDRVLAFTTSITFDLKAIIDEVHRALTGAPVDPVLRNATILAQRAPEKIWEFRIPVIPGINEVDISMMSHFLADLGPDLPVCFLTSRPNFVLEHHPGPDRELMDGCVSLARQAGLTNVSWAGTVGINHLEGERGRRGDRGKKKGDSRSQHTAESYLKMTGTETDRELDRFYASSQAGIAGTQALAAGCITHPRDCAVCSLMDSCPVKVYVPDYRS